MVEKLYEGNLAVKLSQKSQNKLGLAVGTSQSARRIEKIKQMAKALVEEAESIDREYESDDRVAYYLMEIEGSRKRAHKTQIEINRIKKKTQAILSKLP